MSPLGVAHGISLPIPTKPSKRDAAEQVGAAQCRPADYSSSTVPSAATLTAGSPPPSQPPREPVERVVAAVVAMVEELHRARPGAAGELDRVVRDRVAEVGLGGQLGGKQLGVVQERVGIARELERGGVVGAEAVLAGAERRRAVVGHVGERRVAVADPVAERAPALVRDLAREHGEALDLRARRGRSCRAANLPAAAAGRRGSTAAT